MSGNPAFAKRVRTLRESRGMSQERIAELVGYTKQAVQRWENNGQTPRNDALQTIADYFKVSLDYLLGRVDSPTDELVPEKKQTPADLAGENIGVAITNKQATENAISFIAEAAGITELTNILRIENNLTYMNVELTRDDIVTIRHMIEMAMRTRLPKIIPIYPARPPIDYSKIPRIEDIDPNSIPLPQEFMWADERINRHEILQAEGRLPTDDDWKHIVYNYKYHPPKE